MTGAKHQRTTSAAYMAVRRAAATSMALKTVAVGLRRLSLAVTTTAVVLGAV